jgi:hypothetical protein
MNVALWAAQVILALVFFGAGMMKLVRSKGELERAKGMGYVTERSATEMKLIGLAEVLGAAGLVLPWRLGILPVLTPLAAVGLAVLMAGAIATHRRRGEPVAFVAVLMALALFVAAGRFGVPG